MTHDMEESVSDISQFLSNCNHMLVVRASLQMKAETLFSSPNSLFHDRVARFDSHAAGNHVRSKTLTSMSF